MTEQQVDALMERIGTLTKFMEWQKEVGFSPSFECELELAALTTLCRYRDRVVYEELYNDYFNIEWDGDKTLYNWVLREMFMEMQTWGDE